MDIFQAIRTDEFSTLRRLAADPALLESRDGRGTTPLVLASYLGKTEATRILVEAGADLDAQGVTGTALMGASFKGYQNVARYLLDAGADPNVRHANGQTALAFARQFDQSEMVDLLERRGAE